MGIPIKDFAAMLAARGEEVAAKDVAALLLDLDKQADAVDADLARVTAERDALRAEVEAMRGVCEAAEPFRRWRGSDADSDDDLVVLSSALDALDALRTRKVGG